MSRGRNIRAWHRRPQVAWVATLFLLAAALLGRPTLACAKTATASIMVAQHYTSDSSGVSRTFTYVLEPVTEGAPLPAGATDEYTWTMTGDEKVPLEVPFESPLTQEYEYRVYQRVDSPKDGFTYDETVYTLRLLYAGAEKDYGILIAYDSEGLKPNEVSWAVSYVAPEVPVKPDAPRWHLPKMGDLSAASWTIVAFGASGMVLIVFGALRKRKACDAEGKQR